MGLTADLVTGKLDVRSRRQAPSPSAADLAALAGDDVLDETEPEES